MRKIIHFIQMFLPLLLLLMVGCEGSETPVNPPQDDNNKPVNPNGTIELTADRAIIEADGADAVRFTVRYVDTEGFTHNISDEAEIYCEGEGTPLDAPRFLTTAEGEFSFYAVYGLLLSQKVEVSAVKGLAQLPVDNRPESFDFHHRLLLVQHTGTECPNCPRMMNILKVLSEDEEYASRYHHVASHSYNYSDEAYSGAAALLSSTMNTDRYYPWLTFNLTTLYAHEKSAIEAYIDELHKEKADVGIAAATSLIGSKIYANIELKAAVEGQYRVGMWILEDNIFANQSGATSSWQNTHHNCLREMAGENKVERIYGHLVSDMESGETLNYAISTEVDPEWKIANCKVLILVTAANQAGEWELVNSTLCPMNGSVDYKYNE